MVAQPQDILANDQDDDNRQQRPLPSSRENNSDNQSFDGGRNDSQSAINLPPLVQPVNVDVQQPNQVIMNSIESEELIIEAPIPVE